MKSKNVKMYFANSIKRRSASYLIAFYCVSHISTALASDLIYTPVNPNFGGNALNGAALLNAAQAQNKTKDPDAFVSRQSIQRSASDQFNEMLERAILTRLMNTALSDIFNSSNQLQAGSVETENFVFNVVDLGGGKFTVNMLDKLTGATTLIDVTQPAINQNNQ